MRTATEKLPVRAADELVASAPKNTVDLIFGTLVQKDGDKPARLLRRVALGWIVKGADKSLAIKDAAAKFPDTAFLAEKHVVHGSEFTLHGGGRANGWWTVQLLAVELVKLYAKYEDATDAEPEIKGVLDHTSILKFIGEKFNGGSYSQTVDNRPVGSVSDVLNLSAPRGEQPAEPPVIKMSNGVAGYVPGSAPNSVISKAFTQAVRQFNVSYPAEAAAHFGDVMAGFPELTR